MKQRVFLLIALVAGATLAGCDHPSASLSTLQDAKYPLGRDSKIALPDYESPQVADLANRLAGETIEEQMRALGFHLVPASEADFQLSFNIADKNESQSYTVDVPTISNMVGDSGQHTITGTVYGDQVVPETRTVSMTQLDIWLKKTAEPKLEVWHGHIRAEASELQQFRTPFFRILLEHIGDTAQGEVLLDAEKQPAK